VEGRRASEVQKIGKGEFLRRVEAIHGKKYIYPEFDYENCRQRIEIYCTTCEVSFSQRILDHLHYSHGCPYCKQFRSEKLCREIIEELTGFRFIKCKPKWLEGLELDGYSEESGTAFEYQGLQHYTKVDFFHRYPGMFEQQLKRDMKKRELCNIRGVRLVEIPYTYSYRNPAKLKAFIKNELRRVDDNSKSLWLERRPLL
jgi:hypothetical protein